MNRKRMITFLILLSSFTLSGCSSTGKKNDTMILDELNKPNTMKLDDLDKDSNIPSEEPISDSKSEVTENIISSESEDGKIIVTVATTKDFDEDVIKEISVIVDGVTLNTIHDIVGYFDTITLDSATSTAMIKYHGRKWSNFALLDLNSGQILYYEPFHFEDIQSAFQDNTVFNYSINENDLIEYSFVQMIDSDSVLIYYQAYDIDGNLQSGTFTYKLSSNEFEDLSENPPESMG